MTHSIKRKCWIVILELFMILSLFLFELIFTSVNNPKWQIVIAAMIVGIILLFSWLANRYKRRVVPASVMSNEPIGKQLVFNNSFDWFPFVTWAVATIIAFAACPPVWQYSTGYQLLTAFVMIMVFLPYTMSYMRNRYRIEDNTLVVQEYDLFRMTTDMRIPIDTINAVYLRDEFTIFPKVLLEIEGIERTLRCTTHSDALASALATLITQKHSI